MTDPEAGAGTPGNDLGTVLDEARELIKRLEGSTVKRLRVEAGDYKIEIERGTAAGPAFAAVSSSTPTAASDTPAGAEADNRHPVVAPLVGTFYRASGPGAKAFVEEGDVIEEGATVGILEAMKLMNQVKADRAGKIAEITAKDGDWVEFEQVLMYLEPAGD